MNKTYRFALHGAIALAAMAGADAPRSSFGLGLLPEAQAIIGIAPGGSIARRHAIVGTAAVTTTAVAATTANASAAAAANANAQAAQAAAAKPPPAPAPGAAPAVGSIVGTLPPGCVQETLNAVAYQRCGSTYYRASMMGSNLVFIVSQP
jgi:hypothetical protein